MADPTQNAPSAAAPFRLFFFSGAVWSLIGVSLWPLFLWGKLGFYPNHCHARLMIEGFGGAFVIGLLGALSGAKMARWEWLSVFGLHQANAACHLLLRHAWGDALFAALLLAFLVRMTCMRKITALPALGLLCGSVGAALALIPHTQSVRLSGLLLHQGMPLAVLLSVALGKAEVPRLIPALTVLAVAGSLIIEILYPPQRIALEHLVYIGGIGLLLLFTTRESRSPRWMMSLAFVAAATRMIPGFMPRLTFSHYQYAALLWVILVLLWLAKTVRHPPAPHNTPAPTPACTARG